MAQATGSSGETVTVQESSFDPKAQADASGAGYRPPGLAPEQAGIRFLFKYDDLNPADLFITSVNKVSANEAITTFFRGVANWNHRLRRFETHTPSHTLFWCFFHEENTVIVITCFRANNSIQTKHTVKSIWIKDAGDFGLDTAVDDEIRKKIEQIIQR